MAWAGCSARLHNTRSIAWDGAGLRIRAWIGMLEKKERKREDVWMLMIHYSNSVIELVGEEYLLALIKTLLEGGEKL